MSHPNPRRITTARFLKAAGLMGLSLATGVTANPAQVGTGSSSRNAMSGGSSPFNQLNQQCGGPNAPATLEERKFRGFGKSGKSKSGGGGSSAGSAQYAPYSNAAWAAAAAAAAGLTGGLLP